ncbi:tubulin-specific chaperone E [Anopheles cruzii]|uniref:tubulin-specific chaperone E n=1 Tax=Anopheles cruzii TaxID=68878 RepID=UPI0022EC8AA9|nr:tubulin-specific chaperone E [Anopheles cruzii]
MILQNHLERGVRVKVGQHFGTVRYVGEVPNTDGEWIGIEWDDPVRGKHSGTVNGVQYFQTRSPNAGSLIRGEKLTKFETLEQAITKKYTVTKDTLRIDSEMLREVQKQMHATLFEIVGMEKVGGKQSNLSDLLDVSVCCSPVNAAGDLSRFSNLQMLDVSSTLLWNWNVIGSIVEQIPTLQELNLSNNRFVDPYEEQIALLAAKFHNIRKIILKNCALGSWSEVVRLARLWPAIEYLSVEQNGIAAVDDEAPYIVALSRVKLLDLQNNSIADVESLQNLGRLPALEELQLNGNGLREVRFAEDCPHNEKVELFRHLRTLYLRNNPLQDQSSAFNELDKLARLEHVTLDPDPSVSYEETVSRIVGSIAGLRKFNRATINEKLRRDSECDMWKLYANRWAEVRNDAQQLKAFFKTHRMYPRVMERLGSPEQVLPDTRKITNMIHLQLLNELTGEKREKKVPKRIILHTLQNLIVKLFGLPDGTIALRLYLLDRKRRVRMPLENHGKSLDFYSVEDNDTIVFE